ncbi:tRNA/rRNA methyltransferase SpoU [Candidatus Omnitrophus magneticus]|uniref:tRNA/rRNA methyltransferase SpoU n=1 Tax=Candidatus Omnitrophus magneticus TaxID=1609969 RepID=A0A0F0CJ99_9BACT|nr:tRNA/rRNA methyltransferase SpoU [Candidatus Omnitrophus magneticus]
MANISKNKILDLRELYRKKKERDRSGLFIAEGVKILRDIINKNIPVESVFLAETIEASDKGKNLIDILEKKKMSFQFISRAQYEKISNLENPEGVLSVIKKNIIKVSAINKKNNPFLVLCDSLQNPGNLGTIIRDCSAFNVSGIILTGDSADPYNPKTVRATTGTVLDIPIFQAVYGDIAVLKKEGYKILVSALDHSKGVDIAEVDISENPFILVFGSEGEGVSEELRNMADTIFYIPINKKCESLNVVSASAIAIYSFSRKS